MPRTRQEEPIDDSVAVETGTTEKDTCYDYDFNCLRSCVYSNFGSDSIAFIDSLMDISVNGIGKYRNNYRYQNMQEFFHGGGYDHDPSIKKFLESGNYKPVETTFFLVVAYLDKSNNFEGKRVFSIKTAYQVSNFWTTLLARLYVEIETRRTTNFSDRYESITSCDSKEPHVLFIKLLYADWEYNYGSKDKVETLKQDLNKNNFFKDYTSQEYPFIPYEQ